MTIPKRCITRRLVYTRAEVAESLIENLRDMDQPAPKDGQFTYIAQADGGAILEWIEILEAKRP